MRYFFTSLGFQRHWDCCLRLQGMTKMFLNETTTASAWLHLLAIDHFVVRQVYHDGPKNKIDTRLSVSLCLMSCPIGILFHLITKLLPKKTNHKECNAMTAL